MADCDSIEGLLSSLSNQVATLNQKVADLEEKKADKNRVESLAKDVAKLFSEIAGILTQVNQIVETAVKPIREAVAYILGMIDRFLTKPELSDLERKVNNLAIELSGTTALARGASNGVISLRSRVQGIEKDIIWLKDQLTEVIKEVTRQIGILHRKIDGEVKKINEEIGKLWIAVIAAAATATLALTTAKTALEIALNATKILAQVLRTLELLLRLLRTLKPGRDGKPGRNGRDGRDGKNGKDGKDGAPGPQGPPGRSSGGGGGGSGNGARGPAGPAGKDGKDGKNGKDGKDGPSEIEIKNFIKLELALQFRIQVQAILLMLAPQIKLQINSVIAFIANQINSNVNNQIKLIKLTVNRIEGDKLQFSRVQIPIFTGCAPDTGKATSSWANVASIRGLEGQVSTLFTLINHIQEKVSCPPDNKTAIVLHPGEKYEHLPIDSQLVLEFRMVDAQTKQDKARTWHISIPQPRPVEELNWETHFAPLTRTIGYVSARIAWVNHKNETHGWFDTRENAISFMEKLLAISTLEPQINDNGSFVRITTDGNPKRKPRNRVVKCTRAVWVSISENGEPKDICIFQPSNSSPQN